MKLDEIELLDTASELGKVCDAWGKDTTCTEKPTWQLTACHTSDGCLPTVYLLCDKCREACWHNIRPHKGKQINCPQCKARVVVPDDLILSEVPYVD